MKDRYTATRTSLRTAGIMLLFTLVFTALMAGTYRITAPAIEASELAERMRLINDVLPPENYDNVLLEDFVEVGPVAELGLDQGGRIYRARRNGEPAALILEAVAPDGYAGRIRLAVGVDTGGRLTGIRVTAHRETPGLGDYIDPKKDRERAKPWIGQFANISFAEVAPERWAVRRDGGAFAYRIGATISARAVTDAAGRALAWANERRDALFAAETGSRI